MASIQINAAGGTSPISTPQRSLSTSGLFKVQENSYYYVMVEPDGLLFSI